MTDQEYIKAGKIIGAHGIRGGLKVFSYLESPQNFGKYKKFFIDKTPVTMELNFVKDKVAVVNIGEIRKREMAETYIGKEIYILKSELPELKDSEFYYSDLIGLKIIENGKETGVIKDIQDFGAGEIIEIEFSDDRKTKMVIFNNKNFPEIDKKKGFALLNLPEEEFDKSNA